MACGFFTGSSLEALIGVLHERALLRRLLHSRYDTCAKLRLFGEDNLFPPIPAGAVMNVNLVWGCRITW